MSIVVEYNKIAYDKISFSKLKKKDGRYTSYIQYDTTPLYIQTPKLKLLGIEEYEKDNIITNYLLIEVKANSSFYNFCKEFESYNIDSIVQRSEKWFNGRQLPLDFIKKGYSSIVTSLSPDSEDSYILRLAFKPTVSQHRKTTGIFNQHRKSVNISELKKGRSIVLIIEPYCLQIGKKTIECNWRSVQVEVKVPRPTLKGYSIHQYSDDESDDYPSPDEESDYNESDSEEDEDIDSSNEYDIDDEEELKGSIELEGNVIEDINEKETKGNSEIKDLEEAEFIDLKTINLK